MATLADIRKATKGRVHTDTDSTTPDGTFFAVATASGIVTTYLLAGHRCDESAPILGRIESQGSAVNIYVGGELKGGEWIMVKDSSEAFEAMAGIIAMPSHYNRSRVAAAVRAQGDVHREQAIYNVAERIIATLPELDIIAVYEFVGQCAPASRDHQAASTNTGRTSHHA